MALFLDAVSEKGEMYGRHFYIPINLVICFKLYPKLLIYILHLEFEVATVTQMTNLDYH